MPTQMQLPVMTSKMLFLRLLDDNRMDLHVLPLSFSYI